MVCDVGSVGGSSYGDRDKWSAKILFFPDICLILNVNWFKQSLSLCRRLTLNVFVFRLERAILSVSTVKSLRIRYGRKAVSTRQSAINSSS